MAERYVMNEAGEVVDILQPGDKIVRRESTDSYHGLVESKTLMANSYFVGIYLDSASYLSKRLKPTAVSMLWAVLPYIEPLTYRLMIKRDNVLTKANLLDVTGVCKRSMEVSLKELIAENCLAVSPYNGKWSLVANPYLFKSGGKVMKSTASLFSDNVMPMLSHHSKP